MAAHIVTNGRYGKTFWWASVLPAVLVAALTLDAMSVLLVSLAGLVVQPTEFVLGERLRARGPGLPRSNDRVRIATSENLEEPP